MNALDFLSFLSWKLKLTTIIELNFNREIAVSFVEKEKKMILLSQELLPIEKFHDKSRRQIHKYVNDIQDKYTPIPEYQRNTILRAYFAILHKS